MKKKFLTLLFSLSILAAFSQTQFGIAGLGVFSKPGGDVGFMPSILGFRGEIMGTKLGIQKFRLSYLSVAVTDFPSANYPTRIELITKNGSSGSSVEGSAHQSEVNGILKFGFEIRQHWSEFLFLNAGLGGGMFSSKIQYKVSPYDTAVFNTVGLPPDGSLKKSGKGLCYSFFFSAFYEFEKFYLFFQAEGIAELPFNFPLRDHYILAGGIYYKLYHNN